jgi:hypothetical protein
VKIVLIRSGSEGARRFPQQVVKGVRPLDEPLLLFFPIQMPCLER